MSNYNGVNLQLICYKPMLPHLNRKQKVARFKPNHSKTLHQKANVKESE